ncbi:MAG: hypothetical protein U5L04_09595 [Trueperaceae bacterium]|nr:hypothetical protein [Trueperaceae bacterium]
MTTNVISLDPNDVRADHPFSHPDYSRRDGEVMRDMIGQVGEGLEPSREASLYRQDPADEGWQYRLIVPNADVLRQRREFEVVGFFGQRQTDTDADPRLLDALDDILIAELPTHPGIVCYFSKALGSGDYCNLVLFVDRAAKELWATSEAYAFATRRLAPEHYASVRIHNGWLRQGLANPDMFVMTCSKYFAYRPGFWQALRRYENR